MIVAIQNFNPMDGWCNCTHLIIPDDMDLDKQKADYKNWLNNWRIERIGSDWVDFIQWLKNNGASDATDIVEFEAP